MHDDNHVLEVQPQHSIFSEKLWTRLFYLYSHWCVITFELFLTYCQLALAFWEISVYLTVWMSQLHVAVYIRNVTSVTAPLHDSLSLLCQLQLLTHWLCPLLPICAKCFLTFTIGSFEPLIGKGQSTLRPTCGKSLLLLLLSITVNENVPPCSKKSEH